MGNLEWIITGLGIFTGILGIVCAIVLPILIIGGIVYSLYKRNQQSMAYREAIQTWPSTAGTVLMSSVQLKHTGNSTSAYPAVIYVFAVNRQSYQSQTIKAGEQFLNVRSAGLAQETVNRYPIGAAVTVYYNPSNPSESVLER